MIYAIVFVVVFVVLFIAVPKKAAIGLLIAASVVLIVGGLIYWNDYSEQQVLDSVVISMALDKENCPGDRGLRYSIDNQTGDTLYRVYFRYSAYKKGYSSPISKSYRNDVTENKIIEVGASHTDCIPVPDLNDPLSLDDVEFKVEHKRVWDNAPVL